jgi:dTDP-4-dehydrorhamnose 3,5-epimerase
MKFTPTSLAGAWLIDIEPISDARGFFARTVCFEQFISKGLSSEFVQQSISWNKSRGIIRGIHYQSQPHEEDKLVRVTAGKIFDVLVDLRRDSPTFTKWYATELSSTNRRAVYVPRGIAHGYQVLEDSTEILYEMTATYVPTASYGIRWNDPDLAIEWPYPEIALVSERDQLLPALIDWKKVNE